MQSARTMLQLNFVLTQDASKDDDGPYRLSLENTLGNDSAVIKIQVNGECALPVSSIPQASGQIWLFVPVKLRVVAVESVCPLELEISGPLGEFCKK